MNKLELGFLIRAALKQALQQQAKLVGHPQAEKFTSVIKKLAKFNVELEAWYSDKYHLKDRNAYFLSEAEKIEAEADEISEDIWTPAVVSIAKVFRHIRDQRASSATTISYPNQLRAQFDNFRMALLEQASGARLLENNNDLGEEIERILVQYFERRVGTTVRVLRGGHIYDYENNRSGQIDVIITPANALGFCPADTGDGKYNVMIDQVLAAISVTSRLTAAGFRERLEQLQQIPNFNQRSQNYPNIGDNPWPICFIVAAECDDLDELRKIWDEMPMAEINPLRMVLALDSGYIRFVTLYPPRGHGHPEKIISLQKHDGIYAGLGLGWIETLIALQNCFIAGQNYAWVQRLQKQLITLEQKDAVPATFDMRRELFVSTSAPIHGIATWGWNGRMIHNRLSLSSVCVGEKTLLNDSMPIEKTKYFGRYDFEPRWFKVRAVGTNGDFFALEEWVDPIDRERHQRRVVVFDGRNGKEVTHLLSRPLERSSDLSDLNPVLKVSNVGAREELPKTKTCQSSLLTQLKQRFAR